MSKLKRVCIGFLVIVSVVCLGYPKLATWVNSYTVSKVVQGYSDGTDNLSSEEIQNEFEKANKYNEDLFNGIEDEKNYSSILNLKDGIIGTLSIPSIDFEAPIYHGVSNESITKGVGHMPNTSFPTGEESTHAVLSSHSGMPNHIGFTNLEHVKEGDVFTIRILDKETSYEVDQIKVVDPNDDSDIQTEEGKTYVTLLTCYPYGVNTHRLLVRGKIIFTSFNSKMNNRNWWDKLSELSFQTKMIVGTVAVTGILIIIIKSIQRFHKK